MARPEKEGVTVWPSVIHYLHDNDAQIALVILNWPILSKGLEKLWARASICVCADGGANRLYDSRPNDREKFIPTAIKGDLDSLRPEVRKFYESHGTDVIPMLDQDEHDLNKSLSYVLKDCDRKFDSIYILGGLDGRFDHTYAAIGALYKWCDNAKDTKLHIITEHCEVMLLGAGKHKVMANTLFQGPHCGLLPVGGPVRDISTSGLRWNLNHDAMSICGLISSSNKFEKREGEEDAISVTITIDTSDPVIWTSEIDLLAIHNS